MLSTDLKTDCLFAHEVTVRPLENGRFQYVGNKVTYQTEYGLQDVKALVSLLRICSNNLNQYAKRANETGSIYRADIEDLQKRLEEIWTDMREVLVRLSSIQ